MTPEYEPLRSEFDQYAIEEEWRAITNSSRKIEEVGPNWKQCSAVDMSGGEIKIQWCKEQYYTGNWNVRCVNQAKLNMVKQEMARVNIDRNQ